MEKIYEEDTPNRQLPKEEFMKKYTEMNHEELLALKKELDKEFEEIKAQGLALDMSRASPCALISSNSLSSSFFSARSSS